PSAHLPQPHPHRRAVSAPVVGVQRTVGQIERDVSGLRPMAALVPAIQRGRLRHGVDLHGDHEGLPSPLSLSRNLLFRPGGGFVNTAGTFFSAPRGDEGSTKGARRGARGGTKGARREHFPKSCSLRSLRSGAVTR